LFTAKRLAEFIPSPSVENLQTIQSPLVRNPQTVPSPSVENLKTIPSTSVRNPESISRESPDHPQSISEESQVHPHSFGGEFPVHPNSIVENPKSIDKQPPATSDPVQEQRDTMSGAKDNSPPDATQASPANAEENKGQHDSSAAKAFYDSIAPKKKPKLPKPQNAITIAVSSRVLFNMVNERTMYENEGVEKYVLYQQEHEEEPLKPGPAFPFV
ncbi:unnamed protein product, partial [Ranitomeya imitator]